MLPRISLIGISYFHISACDFLDLCDRHGLYVIDECSNGEGNVYGVYRDPVATFDGLIKQEAIFAVPGSALKA